MAEWWESDSDFNADWTDADWGEVNNNDSWGWLSDVASDVSDWYKGNKDWIDPAVGFGKEYYKRSRDADQAERELANLKPYQDYMDKAVQQQQAYYDPAAVEAGVGADLYRKAGMLTSQYRQQDQPRFANALSAGKLGSSDFGRKMAQRDAARDTNWANTVVPAAYDQYYNRGAQLGNASSQVAGLFKGQPTMQPYYQDQVRATDPWGSTLDKYLRG